MVSNNILLRDGIVLIHDANNHVVPTKTCILVSGGTVSKIHPDIEATGDVQVVDCTDKIIGPGFIDTHHHGWQTQLKGRHANEQLLEYMITGNAQSTQFSPQDAFYGQLASTLECLAAGTTTVVDHAHITISPDHARLAIAAASSSGIRSVYCYTPIMRIAHFNPLTYHPNPFEDWVMQTFDSLADDAPFGEGRVTLGFAFDLFFLPGETIKGIFSHVKRKGVRTITCHGSVSLGLPVVSNLAKLDLLDEHIIISHGGTITLVDADLVKAKGARLSATPSTELQMAMGRPYCFDAAFVDGGVSGDSIGLQENASLGVDCHSCTAGSIVAEAKLGLQSSRNVFNEFYMKQGKTPRGLPASLSVEAAFNLATVKGAEAVRMGERIGRVKEGYRADLVIFDALSPAMVGAAQHDPVAAVILHSSPADIEGVMVDGIFRKASGKLLPVAVDEAAIQQVGHRDLEWSTIAKEVVKSRERIQESIDKIDFEEAGKSLRQVFHVDESTLIDV